MAGELETYRVHSGAHGLGFRVYGEYTRIMKNEMETAYSHERAWGTAHF